MRTAWLLALVILAGFVVMGLIASDEFRRGFMLVFKR